MKIIISPAKKMKEIDLPYEMTTPVYLDKSSILLSILKRLDFDKLKHLYKANDKITLEALTRWSEFNFDKSYSPAILSYDGIQYSYMKPSIYTHEDIEYISNHLRIISGFYGILKPFDKVSPYRLEMNNPLHCDSFRSLYEFWGSILKDDLFSSSNVIINLCSEEYASVIRRHLNKNDKFVDVLFYEQEHNKLIEKGVYCKMARGLMTTFLVKHKASSPEQMKEFNEMGYKYTKELSNEQKYVFIRRKQYDES